MYNETVMDHFTNPRNVGKIADADGVGETGSFKCGDTMTLYIKVENEIIVDAKFQTFGCGAHYNSSILQKWLGMSIGGAAADSRMWPTGWEGCIPLKLHCSN